MLDLRDFGYNRKYSDGYITYLIVSEGYIPVASGAELIKMQTTANQKMGAGTVWEGNYTTGISKNYIQVRNISLVDYQAGTGWTPISCYDASFTYDGNNLFISDCTINRPTIDDIGLFTTSAGTFKNMRLKDFNIIGRGRVGGLTGDTNASFENIYGWNINITSSTTTSGSNGSGVLIARVDNMTNIINCGIYSGSINASNSFVGGFLGSFNTSAAKTLTIQNCFSFANVTNSDIYTGGFIGFIRGRYASTYLIIKNCFSGGFVNGGTQYTGGFIGFVYDTKDVVENCYSFGKVTAGATYRGGFCGRNSGTITNCYYDKDTAGQSDTGKGLPRTTAQMVNGTANSFILANGDIDPDSLAANAMYTGWDESIWRFHNNKYPKIKRI